MRGLVLRIAAISVLLGVICFPATAFAFDPFQNACPAGGAGGGSAVCQENNTSQNAQNPNPLTGSNGLLMTVANIVAAVTGIVAVIVIILAGWKYITSGGDASKAKGAKDTLVYAVIGLVVIAAADIIISFVLSKL